MVSVTRSSASAARRDRPRKRASAASCPVETHCRQRDCNSQYDERRISGRAAEVQSLERVVGRALVAETHADFRASDGERPLGKKGPKLWLARVNVPSAGSKV